MHQIADTGRRVADYLDRRGFEGAVGELQDFARRRPGTFLLGAAVAGFLVGRAAKAAQAFGEPVVPPSSGTSTFPPDPSATGEVR